MRAVMVMFDSLNRHMLPNYGNEWIKAPNFKRLNDLCVTFDNFYAGSLPCMPARRELHTGRYNFLHRSWGPLEPFDVSMPELLNDNGIHTHLVSDHYHYLEDGGATYHSRYKTWDIIRGQEGDPVIGQVKEPEYPEMEYPRLYNLDRFRQDFINREAVKDESDFTQSKVFKGGIEFIETNKDQDNWFLQIEEFDPHEPYFSHEKYKKLYEDNYDFHFDWPNYGKVSENEEAIKHCRNQYASLISMCDYNLGKVLEAFDKYDMWKDTMLIINTDHGFMLGEKQWWGKNIQPMYNEIVNTPFFLYDPRHNIKNQRRSALTQTIDIAPTVLDYFNVEIPDTMEGKSLNNTYLDDTKIHDTIIYGIHGGHVNITDGSYVYMRANTTKNNQPLNEYTLMPTHMRGLFSQAELKNISLIKEDTFSFANIKLLKIPTQSFVNSSIYGHLLFDLKKDKKQEKPLQDDKLELSMIHKLINKLEECDAPNEQFKRLGLEKKSKYSKNI